MTQYAMLIDYKYCTFCHACEVSCRTEHDIPLDEWGIKVVEMGPKKLSNGTWQWDYVPVPGNLCDLCADRVAEGKKPRCMVHCLGACMELVPVEEVGQKLAEHGNKTVVYTAG